MQTKPKQPITCRICGFSDTCSPCHFGKEIDYKTRTGICKRCAKPVAPLGERVNQHSILGTGKINTIKSVLQKVSGLSGDTAELGVYKGGTALMIASTLLDADCYLFDTFDGMPVADEIDVHKTGEFADTELGAVQKLLGGCKNAKFRVGLFPETAQGLQNKRFKFVHIDGDQYQTTLDALEFFYPRMVEGGVMLFDDYKWQNCPGVEKALREFMQEKPEIVESPHEYQAMIVKGNKPAFDVYSSGKGIGDTISALYAVCGAVAAGHRIRYHARHYDWLTRVSFPGLEIVNDAIATGYDLNQNYSEQLATGAVRKQWYCNNIARAMGVETFKPAAPVTDRLPRSGRIEETPYVLLSPFSAYSTREWSKAHWQRLAIMLQEAGYRPIALGGPGDGQSRRLKEYFGSTTARWFWGHSADWVIDAMLHAEAVIGNDSGMVHVASLFGVKAIAVHAHISPECLWNETTVIPVYSDAPCAGCAWQANKGWRSSCDSDGCSALMGITPVQVLEALTGKKHDTRYTPDRDLRAILGAIDLFGSGNIVEIGCNEGVTTSILADAYPGTTIYGIDFTDIESLAEEQRGEVPGEQRIGIKAIQPNVRIFIQDSKALDYSSLNDVGIVFIDGDHSYEGVKADTELALAHLQARGSGLILWHDAYEDAPEWCGVWRYLQELKAMHDVQFVTGTRVAYLNIRQL